MTLIWGSVSWFFSSSLFRCVGPNTPSISNLLTSSYSGAVSSTQAGVKVIHLPRLNCRWSSPHSDRSLMSASSRDTVFQLWGKTWTLLWILSTRLAPNMQFQEKTLSYCRPKRSILRGHVAIAQMRGPSSPRKYPDTCKIFLVMFQSSWVVVII